MSAAVARLRALLDADDADDRRGIRDAILFGVYLIAALVVVSLLMGEGVPL